MSKWYRYTRTDLLDAILEAEVRLMTENDIRHICREKLIFVIVSHPQDVVDKVAEALRKGETNGN